MSIPNTTLTWLQNGEIGSETVLNRPLIELLENDEVLTVGATSSTDKAIAIFTGTTGKVLDNSLVTITASGTLELPAGQSITVGGEAYASSKRFRVWMGL